MAITDAQKVDLLFKKVGFGVTKTDTSTNKSPANESISSPLLIRGDGLYSQSDSITSVALLPTSNVSVAGTTVVAVHRDSLSSAVQLTNDGTAAANRTWKTNLTDWIGPEFGAGYSVKVYTGAALTAATASTGTSLPIDGSGNNDSWYFDYQAGILNFADTNVPSTLAAQVWVVGARYTGAKGIATLPSLAVTGNITSTAGNLVLTNGNIYAANYYGNFTGTVSGTAPTANVAYYEVITPISTSASTFYPKLSNLSIAGNSITGVSTNLSFVPSTGTLAATVFSGTGAFTSATATTLNASAGNITTGYFGSLNTANAVISGGYISALTNATITTGTFTTLNAGTATSAVLNATAGNITTGYFGSLNTANARITGGYADSFPIGANTAATGAFTTLTASGQTTLTNTTQATNYQTGALVVSGGMGVTKDVYIQGNLYVANLISSTTSELIVSDPLLYLTANSIYPYNYDIGFFSHFRGGSANNYQHTGAVRSSTNGYWGFFSNVITEPGTVINWADSSLIWDPVRAGELTLSNTTVSTNTTTGALKVSGGVGIGGALNVGGAMQTGGITSSGTIIASVVNAGTIGNTGAILTGTLSTAAQTNVTSLGTLTGLTVSGTTALAGTTASTLNATAGNVTTLYAGSLNTANAVISGGYISALTNATITTATVTTLNAVTATAATLNATAGNITTGYFGSLNTANAVISGGYISALTNATITTATVTTLNAVTATAATLNATAGNVTTGYFGSLNTANAVITGGYINNLANLTATTAVATNFSSGNIYFSGTTAGTVSTANVSLFNSVTALTTNQTFYPQFSNISTTGNSITGVSTNLSFNPSTGVLTATSFSGAMSGGTASFTTLQATNFSSGNVAITGGYIQNLANVTAASSTIGTMNASAANISGALFATSINTANAVISGGYINNLSNITAASATIGTVNATVGNITTLQATNFSTGNAVISGGYISALTNATITTATVTTLNAGTTTSATLNATAGNITTLQATNFSTGNAVISGGYISALTNATITTATITTLNAGTTTSATLNATAGNVTTLQATNFSTGNAVISGGYISALTNATITTATITTATVTNFASGNLNATGTTNGTWSTANVALSNQIATSSVNATFYPSFYNILSGNAVPFVNSALNYNPSTGALAATTFSGSGASLTNLPGTAVVGTVTTATNAINTGITSNTSAGTAYVTFAAATSGNAAQNVNTSLTYVPSTGALTSTSFNGVGTFSTATTSSTFVASGNIVAASATDSTSSTTGALVVVGGTGIAGNITAGKAATFNSTKTAGQDFVVKGKTDETLIWARPGASYDQVVIGNSATTSTLVTGAKLIINTTDSMMVPVGSTSQRPSSAGGTDTAGMLRYNSTSNALEYYNGTQWQTASSSFTTVTDTQFNGDGSTVAFTSSNFTNATTNGLIVSINGVVQIPTLAYSLTGTTITFTEAPASGDVIDVRVLLTTSSITSIASVNGYMGVSADNNGVYVSTGTSSATVYNWFNTTGAFVSNVANVSVASANTVTTIDTLDNSIYRSAKYVIQATNGGSYQVSEALVVSDGTTATIVVYGTIQTAGNLGVIAATQSGGSTLVQFIAANATNNVRVRKEYMVI